MIFSKKDNSRSLPKEEGENGSKANSRNRAQKYSQAST
jgi:hypothetical protein